MSIFGFKQDKKTATPATATVTKTPTKLPREIQGVPVVTQTTTIGVKGDVFANFVHANEHSIKIHRLPEDINKRIEHLEKMLAIFPSVRIEVVTVTR